MIIYATVFGLLIIVFAVGVAMTGDDTSTVVMGICGILLGGFVIATPHLGGGEPPCSEYGHVPVVIDGQEHCVPWEKASELMEVVGE